MQSTSSTQMAELSNGVLTRILAKVSLRDMIILGRVNRLWRKVSQLLIDSSSICFLYRLTVDCAYPAKIALERNCCDAEKSVEICRLTEFLNSPMVVRVVRLVCFYPVVLPNSIAAELLYPIASTMQNFINVRTIEYIGNDMSSLYACPGRLTVKSAFPKLSQCLLYSDYPEFQIRLESLRENNFTPTVQLRVKADYDVAVASAFAQIDECIENLRADGVINEQKFNNTVAMRELAAMMPLASLKFAIPTKLDGTSVLSSVSELRLVVGENHNLVATLTQLPKLKILELSDERRCSCVVRLPPMPQLISLTLAIHSCPSDRNLLSMVPNLENLHIHSEECGGIALEHLALNMGSLPKLTVLILNCWDRWKMFGTADSDDILPDILCGARRLRKLFLGPGLQPTFTGLSNILAKCQLSLVEADLSASIYMPDDIDKLIGLISHSGVEILRTKIPLTIDDLTKIVVNLLNRPHLDDAVSRRHRNDQMIFSQGSKRQWSGKSDYSTSDFVSIVNPFSIKWESENDVVIKSRLISNSNLFRIRKVPHSRPLQRLKQLRSRGFRPAQIGCEIPQLCGPDGPSFTCGGCGEDEKIQISLPQRSPSDLSAKMKSLNLLPLLPQKCNSANFDAQHGRTSSTHVNSVLWLTWNDNELKKHFCAEQSYGEEKSTLSDSNNCHTHWIRFVCV